MLILLGRVEVNHVGLLLLQYLLSKELLSRNSATDLFILAGRTLATSGVEVSWLARYPDCFQFPAASECVVSLVLTLLIILDSWATVNWERASVSLAV